MNKQLFLYFDYADKLIEIKLCFQILDTILHNQQLIFIDF